MGFLLYTKDSIHFCISYMDICLFNIDIFFALCYYIQVCRTMRFKTAFGSTEVGE